MAHLNKQNNRNSVKKESSGADKISAISSVENNYADIFSQEAKKISLGKMPVTLEDEEISQSNSVAIRSIFYKKWNEPSLGLCDASLSKDFIGSFAKLGQLQVVQAIQPDFSSSNNTENAQNEMSKAEIEETFAQKQKEPQASCHHCKHMKVYSQLYWCTNVKFLRHKKKRHQLSTCHKKYCKLCINYHYKQQEINTETWICPSCNGFCHCAYCEKSRVQKDKKNLRSNSGTFERYNPWTKQPRTKK